MSRPFRVWIPLFRIALLAVALLACGTPGPAQENGGGNPPPSVPAESAPQRLSDGPGRQENPRRLPVTVSEQALKIHHAGMVFDGHNDLPWRMRAEANSDFDKRDILRPQPEMHTDIPRLRSGGVKAQYWSVYVPVSTSLNNSSLLVTMEQIDLVHRMCRRYPDVFEIALNSADLKRIVKEGRIASLIGVEGGHSMENSMPNLQRLYDRGARYMTLTHSRNTEWADSCTDEPKCNGLSAFGREVVLEMNRLGMQVDISHVSPRTMHDALDVTLAPVIFSHSSARSVCDVPRNVPDDVLARLPENGGVVMINFNSGFVVPTGELKKNADAPGTVHDVMDHIEHVIRTAGIDHVGLGSDYDGIDSVPIGLENVATYPVLTQLLLERGYSETDIHKVLGGNALRVLEKCEEVSGRLKAGSKDQSGSGSR